MRVVLITLLGSASLLACRAAARAGGMAASPAVAPPRPVRVRFPMPLNFQLR